MKPILFLYVLGLLAVAFGDVYMHNPRGSNDRNCERTVNRRNGNRVFDSQNNNNGGYACPRGVGSGTFQNEAGDAKFSSLNVATGQTTEFTQNKRVYYYAGSVLPIEWTQQHGCGDNSKVSCEIILQYACEDTLDPRVDDFWPWVNNKAEKGTTYRGTQHFRSGENIAAPRDGVPIDSADSATDTIPDNEAAAIPDTAADQRFGMHESYNHYKLCQHTERNKGLYTADQRVRRRDQRGTRQNPNGNRNGLECPEERDYYPWWHPSPWVDIAVLTDQAKDEVCYPDSNMGSCSKRCQYYMNNTMNAKPKGYCDVDHKTGNVATKLASTAWTQRRWYNNRVDCETEGFVWYEVSHADVLNLGTNNFVCAKTQYARANHLGNGRGDSIMSENEAKVTSVKADLAGGVQANRFLWTVPDIPTVKINGTNPNVSMHDSSKYFTETMTTAYKSCSLRIRYNISTGDFQQWPMDANLKNSSVMVDSNNNSRYEGDPRTPIMQDPYVYIGPGDTANRGDKFVSLAVNTNQYGRTFQDRSYVFTIKPLPTADTPSSTLLDTPEVDYTAMAAALAAGGQIFNVNVRGKRGNIVQVYPSVEYDFTPNALALSPNDMIHFQWTGSDYNPRRGCNNGEGGPPDANTFSTSANANKNTRADRNNILFTDAMAHNLPTDYTGYSQAATLSWEAKQKLANTTMLAKLPCYDPATDSIETARKCYAQIMRLGYLNQQLDGGSLVLRAGKQCLTQAEIDAITNRNTAEHHPLNCAKINAKPFPYFDGGIMVLKKNGMFPFYSSRNNNFSNREQLAVLCVGPSCAVNTNNVLQDTNPQKSGIVVQEASTCFDTSTGASGEANNNGATSCIGGSPADPQEPGSANDPQIILTETSTINEGDNDNKGDGNLFGCEVQSNFAGSGSFTEVEGLTSEQEAGLAVGLIAAGIFLTWFAYWVYYRYNPKQNGFRGDDSWIERSRSPSATRDTRYAQANANPRDWMSTEQDGVATDNANPSLNNKNAKPSSRKAGAPLPARKDGGSAGVEMPSQGQGQRSGNAPSNMSFNNSNSESSSSSPSKPSKPKRGTPPPPPGQDKGRKNRMDYL